MATRGDDHAHHSVDDVVPVAAPQKRIVKRLFVTGGVRNPGGINRNAPLLVIFGSVKEATITYHRDTG